MLAEFNNFTHIYIACGHTDMRKSIDGLAAIVVQNFNLDPFQKSLFLFCGRKRDRIKGLLWEGDGFCCYKRLEEDLLTGPKIPGCIRDNTSAISLANGRIVNSSEKYYTNR